MLGAASIQYKTSRPCRANSRDLVGKTSSVVPDLSAFPTGFAGRDADVVRREATGIFFFVAERAKCFGFLFE